MAGGRQEETRKRTTASSYSSIGGSTASPQLNRGERGDPCPQGHLSSWPRTWAITPNACVPFLHTAVQVDGSRILQCQKPTPIGEAFASLYL